VHCSVGVQCQPGLLCGDRLQGLHGHGLALEYEAAEDSRRQRKYVHHSRRPCVLVLSPSPVYHFDSCVPGEPGSASTSVLFLHLLQKRIFVNEWHWFYRVNDLPPTQPTVVESLKQTQCSHPTHSLNSLLCLTSEGHSDLHVEQSRACDQITSMSQSWSATTCYSHVFRGRPSGHFQPAARWLPFVTLITGCNTVWAGVPSGRRMMWPKMACLRSAITSGRSTSFVCPLTESLVIKSYQLICRMRSYAFMWNACTHPIQVKPLTGPILPSSSSGLQLYKNKEHWAPVSVMILDLSLIV